MKKFGFLLLLAVITLSFTSSRTDCNTYFPIHKGMRWVTNHYNPKGKLQSATEIKITDEKNTAKGTEYTLVAKPIDQKKDTASFSFTYTCEDDLLKMDMNKLFPQEMLNGMNESMEIKIDQDELEFPNDMTVGTTLKDANINVTASTNGMKIMDIKLKVFDRKIEKSESITTPAGTFECLKLTYKTNMVMGFMNQTTSSVEWISSSAGIVKSELYDKKGKLSEYSELAEFSK